MVVRNGKFATQVAVACLLALPNVFNPSVNVLPLKNSGKQGNRCRFVFGVQDGIFVSSEAGRNKGGPCRKVASRYEEIIFNQPIEQITMLISSALGVRTESLSKQQHAYAVYSMIAALDAGWFGAAPARQCFPYTTFDNISQTPQGNYRLPSCER